MFWFFILAGQAYFLGQGMSGTVPVHDLPTRTLLARLYLPPV